MPALQKITPFLWYDGQAEEAANHYVAIFEDSKILGVTRCGDHGPGPKGSALAVDFQLEGQRFNALNGGPMYRFTEAVSFVVACDTQAELDRIWDRLAAGGKPSRCGWLKDQFGLSWQVVPRELPTLLQGSDPAAAGRAMAAMMQMSKIDLAALRRAHDGP